jgi:hypothetical protein
LSLRAHRHGGDHQNGNNQPQVHVIPPAMMMPNQKKVTKQKKHFAAAAGDIGHVEHASGEISMLKPISGSKNDSQRDQE